MLSWSCIGFSRSTFDICVYSQGHCRKPRGNFVCSRGRHNSNLRHRFPFRKWHVGEEMFCGSKYVQNEDNKMIEFAVKITKVPMSPARKKMRDDLADKAGIHALRSVSGSISWLAGQTRPDVTCQVSQLQQTLPQPIVAQVNGSSTVVRRAC